MGVEMRFLSIYGIKIEWDDDLAEEINYDKNDPHILVDGMGGDYLILGPVLFDSGSDRDGFEGDALVAIEPYIAEKRWKEWKGKFREKFNRFSGYLDEEPKFITLMHCT
jgi:hypothetical protein